MTNKITKVYKNWVEYDIYASGWAAGTGDVTWPSSSTDADIALFDWVTGKLLKDWNKKISDLQDKIQNLDTIKELSKYQHLILNILVIVLKLYI